MGTKLIINLSDDQAIGLIRLAAAASMSLENQVLCLIDLAMIDHDLLPTFSLEEILKDIETNPLPSPGRQKAI